MKKHFPKVKKNLKKSLTKLERIQKVLVGSALITGLAVTGGIPVDSHAAVLSGMHQTTTSIASNDGVLLMQPSASDDVVAYHGSHGSHNSHTSSRY